MYKVAPFLTFIYTHVLSHSQCTHPLSPALCPQIKLCLQLLVIQSLLMSTSGPVRPSILYTTLVWDSLTLTTLKQTQSKVMGGGVGGTADCSHTHCPTVNPTLLIIVTPPSLSPPNFPTLTKPLHHHTYSPPVPVAVRPVQTYCCQYEYSTGNARGRTLWIRFPLH